MINIFTKHPKEVGETYLQHMMSALRFSLTFLFLFVVAFIHAIMPFLFTRTASCVIQEMARHIEKREKC